METDTHKSLSVFSSLSFLSPLPLSPPCCPYTSHYLYSLHPRSQPQAGRGTGTACGPSCGSCGGCGPAASRSDPPCAASWEDCGTGTHGDTGFLLSVTVWHCDGTEDRRDRHCSCQTYFFFAFPFFSYFLFTLRISFCFTLSLPHCVSSFQGSGDVRKHIVIYSQMAID